MPMSANVSAFMRMAVFEAIKSNSAGGYGLAFAFAMSFLRRSVSRNPDAMPSPGEKKGEWSGVFFWVLLLKQPRPTRFRRPLFPSLQLAQVSFLLLASQSNRPL